MKFDSIISDIEDRKQKLNQIIEAMYENIVDIICDEIKNNPDNWSDYAIDLISQFITVYKKDPWNFVKNELDPLIDGTTLDTRKLKIFNIESIKNIKNSILNFENYG